MVLDVRTPAEHTIGHLPGNTGGPMTTGGS